MKILIDCTQIGRNKAGVGAYALNLTRELLLRQRDDLQILVLAQDDDPDFALSEEQMQIMKIPAKFFRHFPLRLVMEQLYIPWLTRKYKVDVLHSLHYSFPLVRTKARKIVTVHDMTSFIIPEVHTRMKLAYFHFFIRAGSRLADALIFVSTSTREDWKRYFPHVSKPNFVIPHGKSSIFRTGLSREQIAFTLDKYGVTKPYLVYVGTIEPRKNLTRLVVAFGQLSGSFPKHTLVLAGMKGWMNGDLFDAIRSLGLESKVILTGFIAEEDKPYLISGAELFAYPSLYEGFGMPILEAMACGTPTLTSNTSSMPEVAGDAVLIVDPYNVEDIVSGLRRLLSDAELRDSIRQKALARASLFDWGTAAQMTINAYQVTVTAELSV
jgi:glycosyltransferase involved in cell wall biosynthesis